MVERHGRRRAKNKRTDIRKKSIKKSRRTSRDRAMATRKFPRVPLRPARIFSRSARDEFHVDGARISRSYRKRIPETNDARGTEKDSQKRRVDRGRLPSRFTL